MKNVTVIFIPLSRFIQEIEQALNSGPNNPCTLHTFLSEYVSNVFVQRHHLKVSSAIEAATKAQDAWKSITDADLTKKMGLSRPILQVSEKKMFFERAKFFIVNKFLFRALLQSKDAS